MAYRPKEVADRLGISPSTLRLWSTHFASQLSEQANKLAPEGPGHAAQRRYTDDDIDTLTTVKQLLAQGLTYEEAKAKLRRRPQQADSRPEAPLPTTPAEIDASLASMREALEAKDKAIAALKESLAFMDIYLRTVLQEREDARAREGHLQRELAQLRAQIRETDQVPARPWWKRLLALP